MIDRKCLAGSMLLSNLKLETRTVRIAGRDVELTVPANPEDVLEASAENDNGTAVDPYWGILWPAAQKTATVLLNRFATSAPLRTLDIGCGIGLTGVAALMCGHSVTFSDIVPEAVELAVENGRRNGFDDARGLVLDWRSPVEEKFDLILASDVLYDVGSHQPLLNLINRMLKSDGEVLLGDTGRGHAISFIAKVTAGHWNVSVLDEGQQPLPAPVRQQFQLFCLTRRSLRADAD